MRRLRGVGAVGPEPPPHPACPAGAQCRPCGFSGASRSGLGSPHSLSHPLQLWPATVGPSLRRGVNGALAGRGPAQPTEARRVAASMWAGRASLSLVGWQLGPPDRAVDGPGARGLVRKPPKDSVQPQPTPCTWTGRHTRELMAPGQRQAWAREGPWGRPARHRLRLSDCLWCAAGEEARGSCRGMRRPWDDPVCWDGQSQAEPWMGEGASAPARASSRPHRGVGTPTCQRRSEGGGPGGRSTGQSTRLETEAVGGGHSYSHRCPWSPAHRAGRGPRTQPDGGLAARCAPRPPPPPLRSRHQTRALCSGEEGAPLDPQVCSPSPRPPGSLLCRPLGALAVSGRPLTSWERFEPLREADGKGGRLLASRHPSLGPWPSAPASLPSRSPVPGLVPWTAGERWRCYL